MNCGAFSKFENGLEHAFSTKLDYRILVKILKFLFQVKKEDVNADYITLQSPESEKKKKGGFISFPGEHFLPILFILPTRKGKMASSGYCKRSEWKKNGSQHHQEGE